MTSRAGLIARRDSTQVAAGAMHVDSRLIKHVLDMFVESHLSPQPFVAKELSERETDVVRLIAEGYGNIEIATQLGISIKTVETYKARAMDKLGLYNRAALVRYALQQGWLNPG